MLGNQESDVVVLEVPRWFHRRRGAREALREKIEYFLSKDRRKFVVWIQDNGRFVSMDVGVLLGVISMVRDGSGIVAIASENEKFLALPHPSVEDGLLRFRGVDDAKRYVEENEPAQADKGASQNP